MASLPDHRNPFVENALNRAPRGVAHDRAELVRQICVPILIHNP